VGESVVFLSLMMGYSLVTLIIVKSQAAEVIVGEPVVLERGDLVLAGSLPVALGHGKTIGIGMGLDETLQGLGVGILGDSECLAAR